MKKVLLLSLSLFIAGTTFADKKCCKDKASCKKEAKCSKDEKKACCKKDHGTAEAKVEDAAAAPVAEMHACCKKSVAAGGKACCAQKPKASAVAPSDK